MDWSALRQHFPVTAHWAFLDHAAVAAPPAACAAAIKDWADDKAVNGITSYLPWAKRVEEARQLAGRLLNADPLDVCFVGSTTHGVGIVAEGYPWQPGDNVIIAAEEYPSNQYPWMNLAHRGVEARSVPSRGPRVHIDDVRAAMDGRTRVLALSSVEFASGYRNDLESLGELCRQRGVFFFVDAIQSLGVFPMDVQQLQIDALSADSHKWLLGPEGAGIAYVRREWVDRLHATGVGWNSVVHAADFGHIDLKLKPHAGRWEGGTVNAGAIAGMGESLRLLLDTGIEVVRDRVLELTDYVCDRVAAAGAAVFSARGVEEKSGIVSLLTPGKDPKAVMKRCKDAGVVVNVRGGRVRVSPHCYNTVEDLDRFLDVLRAA
ncbi:MAG TPA: aminotransferase class V-fold PLP-dependent enzyme [Gemmataceae bacterium]|jgi:cysteine desulfurase/selenocysteine lyase|nr:aminotransferase class V-fold PLP-dependent enzyme [Gemmataceae bacterium]